MTNNWMVHHILMMEDEAWEDVIYFTHHDCRSVFFFKTHTDTGDFSIRTPRGYEQAEWTKSGEYYV